MESIVFVDIDCSSGGMNNVLASIFFFQNNKVRINWVVSFQREEHKSPFSLFGVTVSKSIPK